MVLIKCLYCKPFLDVFYLSPTQRVSLMAQLRHMYYSPKCPHGVFYPKSSQQHPITGEKSYKQKWGFHVSCFHCLPTINLLPLHIGSPTRHQQQLWDKGRFWWNDFDEMKASEMLVAPRISECFGLPWTWMQASWLRPSGPSCAQAGTSACPPCIPLFVCLFVYTRYFWHFW